MNKILRYNKRVSLTTSIQQLIITGKEKTVDMNIP